MKLEITKLRKRFGTQSPSKVIGFCDNLEDLCSKINSRKKYTESEILSKIGVESDSQEKYTGLEVQKFLLDLCTATCEEARLMERNLPDFFSLREVADYYNVSVKTIHRWKLKGLFPRKFLAGGVISTAFLRNTLNKFSDKNRNLVQGGSDYSYLTAIEKLNIADMSNRLSLAGIPLQNHARIIADKFGRNTRTIRGALSEVREEELDGRKIYEDHTLGVNDELIRKKYNLSKENFRVLIKDQRQEFLDGLDLKYEGLDEELVPEVLKYKVSNQELLTREDEIILFKQMNYYKREAKTAREEKRYITVEKNWTKAKEIRDFIWIKNQGLAYSLARRHRYNYSEVLAIANQALERAISKFNYNVGTKFSTYCVVAMRNAIYRELKKDSQYHSIQSSYSHTFLNLFTGADRPMPLENTEVLQQSLEVLDARELEVLNKRFGLEDSQPRTLFEVGELCGLTKERIRQIESSAIAKIKEYFRHRGLEACDFFD